ncbi:Ankyrin repeat domain-containing protein 53 [Balamuthia mandrillaris]
MDTDVGPAAVGEGDANANTNVGTLTRGKQNWACKEGAEQDSSCQTSKRLSQPQSRQEEGPQGSYSTSDCGFPFSQDSSPEDQGQSLSKQKGTIEDEQSGVSDDKHRTRGGVDETCSDNALGGEFRGDENEAQTADQDEYFWEQVESLRKGYSSEECDDTDHLNREMLEEERLWDSLERQRLKEDELARREKQTFGCHPESLFNTLHSTAENEGDSFVAQTQLVQPIASGKEAAVLGGTGNLATIRDDFPVDETLDKKHSAILMALHPQNNREVNVLTLFEANGLPAFRQYYCVVRWGDAKVKTDLSSQSSSPAWNLIFIIPAALLDEGTRNLQRLNLIIIEVFCKKRLLDELMGLVKLKSASNTAQWFPLVSKKKELTGGQLKLQYQATSAAQRLNQQLLADQQNLKQKELRELLDAYSVPSCPILFLERHKESIASSPSDFVVVQAQREGSYPQQIASQSRIDFSLLEAALANSTNDPGVAWANYNEQTFLHLMCLQGNPAIVARLIDNGADINALDGKGSTPLHLAAANGHLECVKVLLDRHADPNVEEPYNRCSPLHHAAQYNQTQVLQLLIESGATVDHKDRNGVLPIHKASAQGHLEAVQILLGAGAFLHAEDREGNNAFLLALLSGHSQVSAYLLEQGADGRCHNTAGDTPLWGAALHLDKCMVEKILCASKKYGIDLNSQTGKHKQTLLHRCVLMLEDQKAKAVIKLLISMGANVNVLNGEGKTPLFLAAYLDRFPLARMLLKRYNAAADVRDAAQNTALFFCSTPRMAKLLLKHGAEVNAVNLSGNTPLHAAYCFHGASVAWVLRQAGASTAVLNCNNNSPEDLLWSYGISAITVSCTPLMASGGNAAATNSPARLDQRTLFGGLHIPKVTSFSPKE